MRNRERKILKVVEYIFFMAKDIQVPSSELKKKFTHMLLNTYYMLEIKPDINICIMFSINLR